MSLSAADKAIVTNLFGCAEFEVEQLVANIQRIFGGGTAASPDPDAISKAVDAAIGTRISDLSDRVSKLEQAPSDAGEVAQIRSDLDALKAEHDKQDAAFKALAGGSGSDSAASAIDKIDPATAPTAATTNQPDPSKAAL